MSKQSQFISVPRYSVFKVLQLFMASFISEGKVLCLEMHSFWFGMLFIEKEGSSLGAQVMLWRAVLEWGKEKSVELCTGSSNSPRKAWACLSESPCSILWESCV